MPTFLVVLIVVLVALAIAGAVAVVVLRLLRRLKLLTAALADLQAQLAPWLEQLNGQAAVTQREVERIAQATAAVRRPEARVAPEALVAGTAVARPLAPLGEWEPEFVTDDAAAITTERSATDEARVWSADDEAASSSPREDPAYTRPRRSDRHSRARPRRRGER